MITRIFNYKEDVRSLVFVGIYFGLVIFQWFGGPFEFSTQVLFLILTCLFSWIAAVITHNTIHCAVFKKRSLNRAFQVVLTLTYGFPVSEYLPGHNLSHHQNTQKPKDVMRTTKVRYAWNLLNAIAFVPRVAVDVTSKNMRFIGMMKRKNPAWYQQYFTELVICWGSKFALVAIDWQKAILIIVIPHLFALWGITAINYAQHDGCDEDHEYNHSRNFVGEWFNWLTFNNGFHGVHHRYPGLHWTKLPEVHARELHPHIHPALEQRSLGLYIFSTLIWPGQRMRYDGKPVVLPALSPDEDWVGPESEMNYA